MSVYNFDQSGYLGSTLRSSKGLSSLRSPARSIQGSDKESISGRSRKGKSRQDFFLHIIVLWCFNIN